MSNRDNDGLTLKEFISEIKYLFSKILRKSWLIALFGIVGGCIGIYYAASQKVKYKSSLTFALEDNGGGLGSAFELAAEFGLNLGNSSKNIFQGDNIIPILTSRRIIENVLLSSDTLNGSALTMIAYYNIINQDSTEKKRNSTNSQRLDTIKFPIAQPRNTFSYLQDSILFSIYSDIVKGNLNVDRPNKKVSIYEVTFTSTDERFTKIFTEKVVQSAIDFYIDLKTSRSRNTIAILEQEVASMKGATNSAIQQRAGIQDANVNPAFAKQQASLQQKQVDVSAYGGAYGEMFKTLEMARYQMLKETPLLQIVDNVKYPMQKIKMGKLKTGLIVGFLFAAITTLIISVHIFLNKSINK